MTIEQAENPDDDREARLAELWERWESLQVRDSRSSIDAFLAANCADDPSLGAELRKLAAGAQWWKALDLDQKPIPTRDRPLPYLQLGTYRLIEKLGEGSFGAVYRARDLSPLAREVAIKLIHRGIDSPQVRARFELERQALARMDHPNIAKVFATDETPDGRPFFVMELVNGLRLTDYCDQHQLPLHERLELFEQVCRAVHHAHQKGLIHRDLKPSNILVAQVDNQPVPKVIDFGMAKETDRAVDRLRLTGENEVAGTPLYMSPEQAGYRNQDIDTRVDVYALGVILYELLTGFVPLASEQWKELYRLICEVDPSAPSEKLSGVNHLSDVATKRRMEPHELIDMVEEDLDWVTMKCLEKDRQRRYDSPAALADDVRRFLRNEPVIAAPPSAVYRAQKFFENHRPQVLLGMLAAVMLPIAIVITTRGWMRAAEETRNASAANLALNISREKEAKAIRLRQRTLVQSEIQSALSAREAQRYVDSLVHLKTAYDQCTDDEPTRQGIHRVLSGWVTQGGRTLGAPMRHPGAVYGISFSPDGERLILRNRIAASLWDAFTGLPLLHVMPREGLPHIAAFAPVGNVLFTSVGNKGQLWIDGSSTPVDLPHAENIEHVLFHPQRRILATVAEDHVRLWDVEGKFLAELPDAHVRSIETDNIAFHPTDNILATVEDGATAGTSLPSYVRFWNALDGSRLPIALVTMDAIYAIAFSPDGGRLSVRTEKATKLFDTNTGGLLQSVASGEHPRFSFDGLEWIVEQNAETLAHDAVTGQLLTWHTLLIKQQKQSEAAQARYHDRGTNDAQLSNGQNSRITATARSPDGARIVTADSDGIARICDLTRSMPVTQPWDHYLNGPKQVLFSADGRIAATSDALSSREDGTIRVFDTEWGERLALFPHSYRLVDLSPDGSRILVSSHEGVQLFDSRTKQSIGEPFQGWARFAHGGTRIFAAEDGRLTLWGARNAQLLRETPYSSRIALLTAHSAGDQIALWDEKERIAVLDVGTLEVLADTTVTVEGRPEKLEFSDDGRWLIVRSESATVLLDGRTAQPTCVIQSHDDKLAEIFFLKKLRRIAALVRTKDSTRLRFWDETGQEDTEAAIPCDMDVREVAFSPDEDRVLVWTHDTLKVFDCKTKTRIGEPIREPGILAARFNGSNSQVVLVHNRGASLYDISIGQPIDASIVRECEEAWFGPQGQLLLRERNAHDPCLWSMPEPAEILPLELSAYVKLLAEPAEQRQGRANPVLLPAIAEIVALHREDAATWRQKLIAEHSERQLDCLRSRLCFTTFRWMDEPAGPLERLAARFPDKPLLRQRLMLAKRRDDCVRIRRQVEVLLERGDYPAIIPLCHDALGKLVRHEDYSFEEKADFWHAALAIAHFGAKNLNAFRESSTEMLTRKRYQDSAPPSILIRLALLDEDASKYSGPQPEERDFQLALQYRQGKFQEALSLFNKAQEEKPATAWQILYAAMASHRLGQTSEARSLYQRVVNRSDEGPAEVPDPQGSDRNLSVSQFEPLVDRFLVMEAESLILGPHVAAAREAESAHDWPRAAEHLRKMSADDLKWQRPGPRLASALAEMDEYDQAIAILRDQLSLPQADVRIALDLYLAQLAANRFDDAQKTANTTVERLVDWRLSDAESDLLAYWLLVSPNVIDPARLDSITESADDRERWLFQRLEIAAAGRFRKRVLAGERAALNTLEESLKWSGGKANPWKAHFLAMTHHALGHRDEAQQWRERADDLAAAHLAIAREDPGYPDWRHRLKYRLFAEERRALDSDALPNTDIPVQQEEQTRSTP
ncbi:MAG: protein kinase [Pirellulales bacterium]